MFYFFLMIQRGELNPINTLTFSPYWKNLFLMLENRWTEYSKDLNYPIFKGEKMTSLITKCSDKVKLYPEQFSNDGEKQSLVNYANSLTETYCNENKISQRKKKGQIFTPPKIAHFMANLFSFHKNEFSILDPGAGTGILIAAICDRIIQKKMAGLKITIDVYENDTNVLPYLEMTLKECIRQLNTYHCSIQFRILNEDFILHHAKEERSKEYLVNSLDLQKRYDLIISNPPYYKLNKDSPESLALSQFVYGQPNIYAFFMLLSGMLMTQDGQMVFITPRSFCSGLYYSRIRKWFVNNIWIDRLHLFEIRKDVFVNDKVLQENLIFHAFNTKMKISDSTCISISYNRQFTQYQEFLVPSKDVEFCKGDDCFIRIPISENDLKIIEIIDAWPHTLNDLGFEISTGPVVDFRGVKHLRNFIENKRCVPLLWMHNIQGINVIWSVEKNGKPQAIEVNPESKNVVLPLRNYVVLKRFTSKEQKKRIHAAVLRAEDFSNFDFIGIENHLNYIHKKKKVLSLDEAYGLAALLNTPIVDQYFRTLNGNTQVNATDIRSLPLPDYDKIIEIGKLARKKYHAAEFDCDEAISKVLMIEKNFIKNSGD